MDEFTKYAVELVNAQSAVRNIPEGEAAAMIQNLSRRLESVARKMRGERKKTEQKPGLSPGQAIKERSVVCLECGGRFKILTKNHLKKHGLSLTEYKRKWGYDKDTSLIAKTLSRQRKSRMEEMEIWKKKNKGEINKIIDALVQDFEDKGDERD